MLLHFYFRFCRYLFYRHQNNDLFPDDEKQHNTPPETPIIIPEYDEQGLLAYLETFNSDGYEGIWTIRNDRNENCHRKIPGPIAQ